MKRLQSIKRLIGMRGRIVLHAMVGAPTTVELDSSFLQSATYDHRTRSLRIKMISGSGEERVYEYGRVTPQTFTDLTQAPSAGRFFNKHIRQLPECQV